MEYHLIGQFSSQGIPDNDDSINSKSHNFVYEVYFFGDHIGTAQALEFDINQFVNGQSFIWGHECGIAGGSEWDVWDNPGQKWHPTGVACNPLNNPNGAVTAMSNFAREQTVLTRHG